ncbi:hypothetical protein NDU88_007781 [Pleurodeles waltl]|uniref:Uncharacterized protein n=1 Tax=Pleurodeles waltl TaxID=8319 RepID=A0AAV7NUK8_PLEWA|nr:hypothetical protein NDU88_007781 [Pleurodeles waltl]
MTNTVMHGGELWSIVAGAQKEIGAGGSSAGLPGDGDEVLRDAAELRRSSAGCAAPLIGEGAVERHDWGPGRNWSRDSSAGLPGDSEETLRDAAELRRGGTGCVAPLIGREGALLRAEERQVRLGPGGQGSGMLRSVREVEAESCPGGPRDRHWDY